MDQASVLRDPTRDLLRSPHFLLRAAGRTDSELRDLITAMCTEIRLAVVIIHVEASGSERGSHRVVWQSISGGPFEDHWFTVPTD